MICLSNFMKEKVTTSLSTAQIQQGNPAFAGTFFGFFFSCPVGTAVIVAARVMRAPPVSPGPLNLLGGPLDVALKPRGPPAASGEDLIGPADFLEPGG